LIVINQGGHASCPPAFPGKRSGSRKWSQPSSTHCCNRAGVQPSRPLRRGRHEDESSSLCNRTRAKRRSRRFPERPRPAGSTVSRCGCLARERFPSAVAQRIRHSRRYDNPRSSQANTTSLPALDCRRIDVGDARCGEHVALFP